MIFGIIGTSEANQEMVTSGLSDLRDKANVQDGVFSGIVGINSETSPAAVTHAVEWMIEEGVSFDLVIEPSMEEDLPDEWKKAADQMVKIRDTDKKVVDRLIKEDGTHLLVFAGPDGPEETVQDHAQRAYDAGIKVHDLADACSEIDFGADVTDAEEDIDFEALGTAAEDEDDNAAQEKLTELGIEAGLDPDDMNEMTWTELAEHLYGLSQESESAEDAPPEPPKGKKTPAKSKGANLWTDEALRDKSIKDLRVIAAQSGVEGAGKLGFEALVAALMDQPIAVESDAEDEEAEEEAAQTKTKRGAKAAAAPEPGGALADLLVGALQSVIREIVREELAAAE